MQRYLQGFPQRISPETLSGILQQFLIKFHETLLEESEGFFFEILQGIHPGSARKIHPEIILKVLNHFTDFLDISR